MFFNSVPSTTSPIAGTTGDFVFNRFGISFQLILPNNCLAGEQIMSSRAMSQNEINQLYQIGRGGMLTPRRRRRAYFAGVSGLRRRLLLTGQV
jgi:hypothetical protein